MADGRHGGPPPASAADTASQWGRNRGWGRPTILRPRDFPISVAAESQLLRRFLPLRGAHCTSMFMADVARDAGASSPARPSFHRGAEIRPSPSFHRRINLRLIEHYGWFVPRRLVVNTVQGVAHQRIPASGARHVRLRYYCGPGSNHRPSFASRARYAHLLAAADDVDLESDRLMVASRPALPLTRQIALHRTHSLASDIWLMVGSHLSLASDRREPYASGGLECSELRKRL